jgi:SAM-dependent MidA family methyltransferase
MTAAGEVLAAEIRRAGPVSFRRFMEVALYHPEHGYYRRARDPFGKAGDFYTAEQIQPVFGILVAARVRQLYEAMGRPADFTVVELGAGKREMAEAFAEWKYVPIDIDTDALPARFTGIVFSNEFFDALPVEVAVFREGAFYEQLVDLVEDRFTWVDGGEVRGEVSEYLRRYFPEPEEGRWYEANLEALAWLERIGKSLENGWILTIDYGITRAESVRFPAGTLMSYHRHTARENVLEDPGERDITAHAQFTALQEHGESCGWITEKFQTLGQMLLTAGEADQFAAALGGGEELRRRMQLKTLLFGMGETFRVLLQRKTGGGGGIETGEKSLKQ